MPIHPTAQIDPSAIIDETATIGPFSIIGPNVVLEANVTLKSHVIIEENTTLRKNVSVASMAVLGGAPQDISYHNEATYLEIGENTRIGEYATIHRSTKTDTPTRVGKDCFLMSYSHIGHDCQVGNHVVLANNTQLAGHVKVDDYVIISAMTGIHQHVHIGTMAMIGAYSAVLKDPPPFSLIDGCRPNILKGLNRVGLRRRGISAEDRMIIKKAYQVLFHSQLNLSQGIVELENVVPIDNPYVIELLNFIQSSKRGVVSRTAHEGYFEELTNSKKVKFNQGTTDDLMALQG